MINDDVAVDIARIEASGLTPLQKQQEFRLLADRLKNKDLRERLEKVVGEQSHPFHKALQSDEVALEYVYYLRANVNQGLGGKVVADEATSALNWVQDSASQQLLEMVANKGKFVTTNGKQMDFFATAAIAKNKAKADKVKKKIGDKDFEQIADDFIKGKITDEDLKIVAPLFKEAQDVFKYATEEEVVPGATRLDVNPSGRR